MSNQRKWNNGGALLNPLRAKLVADMEKVHVKSDERNLGDGIFVEKILAGQH
jgi:hypothetical protein